MQFPFTIEQFMTVFQTYNQALWPTQIFAYLAGLAAVALVLWPRRHSGRLVAAILAAMWLVNGLGYHLAFFSAINPAAFVFAGLFSLGGLLLFWTGVVKNRLTFLPRGGFGAALGWFWVACAAVIYPALGWLFGHAFPRAPMFGLAPCPTTIFTLGLLLLAVRPPRHLVIIPLLWSIIGFGAALNLGVYQDYGLILAGLTAGGLILFRGRRARAGRTVPRAVAQIVN